MPPLTLLLAGDLMTGRGVDQILPHPVDPALHEPWVRDAREDGGALRLLNGPAARAAEHAPVNAATHPAGTAADPGPDWTTGEKR